MKKIISTMLCMIFICNLLAGCAAKGGEETEAETGSQTEAATVPDDLEVYIRWNVLGISSYDSATGRLVKTTDATRPEDYVTELVFDDELKAAFWAALTQEIDIYEYPDEYDPFNDGAKEGEWVGSTPARTIVIRLTANGRTKTVECKGISLGGPEDCRAERGRRFMEAVCGLTDLITSTDEWKALPDYEFLYD